MRNPDVRRRHATKAARRRSASAATTRAPRAAGCGYAPIAYLRYRRTRVLVVVTAALGHSQPQRSRQCVTGLLGKNQISGEEEWADVGGRGNNEGRSGPPELSLTGRNPTTEVVTSLANREYRNSSPVLRHETSGSDHVLARKRHATGYMSRPTTSDVYISLSAFRERVPASPRPASRSRAWIDRRTRAPSPAGAAPA
ncbi:hypothetical protein EVAR_95320_1 [Eumeta japonica]|uniref:Uncharacterized protein n=1 Tax=Eumeta variegata TaxID=151549 RepID=A0A4C1U9Y6_EUMVA|nr:hypothetical protein EVAR_95320_1 [Eumeta japonica]